MITKEEWKKVILGGIEYPYLISNQGRLKNRSGKILKQMDWSCGYKMYKLCRDGKYIRILVHRLVMISFSCVENYKDLQVNHKDGNKGNNTLSNLEWTTQKENILHASKNGIHNGIAYQEVTVFYNSKFFGVFPSINSASKATGINPGNISEIINGKKSYKTKNFSFAKKR